MHLGHRPGKLKNQMAQKQRLLTFQGLQLVILLIGCKCYLYLERMGEVSKWLWKMKEELV